MRVPLGYSALVEDDRMTLGWADQALSGAWSVFEVEVKGQAWVSFRRPRWSSSSHLRVGRGTLSYGCILLTILQSSTLRPLYIWAETKSKVGVFIPSSPHALTGHMYIDEDLIKYAWPQDVWFHVDKLSSAHVYLRMPNTIASWESIPEALLIDLAQLVKANSIEGVRGPTYLRCID